MNTERVVNLVLTGSQTSTRLLRRGRLGDRAKRRGVSGELSLYFSWKRRNPIPLDCPNQLYKYTETAHTGGTPTIKYSEVLPLCVTCCPRRLVLPDASHRVELLCQLWILPPQHQLQHVLNCSHVFQHQPSLANIQ